MSITNVQLPEWHAGTWWVLRVMQRADWVMTPEKPWVGPLRWRFDVREEDKGTFLVDVEVPDSDRKYGAEIRFGKADLTIVDGHLFIDDRTVPMGLDFLSTVLSEHPPGVDLAGEEGEEELARGPIDPEERPPLVLHTYTTHTPEGGIRVSALRLPFHLRLREPSYTVDLESWSME